MRNLYEILGISPDSKPEDVHKAYRRLSARYHPDMPEGNRELFEELQTAHSILMDKRKRISYDKTGSINDSNPDNSRVEAMKELQRVMLQILSDFDDRIFFMDLPSHVLEIFNANIEKSKHAITSFRKVIKRLRRYKKRFKYKPKDDNDFIAIGINAQIYSHNNSISEEIEKIRMFELMLELMTAYDYEPEAPAETFGLVK